MHACVDQGRTCPPSDSFSLPFRWMIARSLQGASTWIPAARVSFHSIEQIDERLYILLWNAVATISRRRRLNSRERIVVCVLILGMFGQATKGLTGWLIQLRPFRRNEQSILTEKERRTIRFNPEEDLV